MEHKPLVGLAMCGSYCTYAQVFAAAAALRKDYRLLGIMSETAAETDTRFGTAVTNLRRLMELTGEPVVTTIAEAEPLGPAQPMDALLIAPCTGNTLAKLAHGITDSEGASQKRPPAGDRLFHERRPVGLGGEHRQAAESQARLFCPLPAGRSGEKAALAAGGLYASRRDRRRRPARRTAPADPAVENGPEALTSGPCRFSA